MQFEQITEELLSEKLITYGDRKPYGQVVYIAGGAGSGKGFAISNFLDSSSFKVRDVDELKKQIQALDSLGKLNIDNIIKKYGNRLSALDLEKVNKIQSDGYDLKNMNLTNPDHVYVLHVLVKATGISDKSLEALIRGQSNPKLLPNIMFDITLKDVTHITNTIPSLLKVGYEPKNIHLTWVLTNYHTALKNNRDPRRARIVPEDILLQTHEGAANTVWGACNESLT
jgi:hypothetical protein